jgi:hypothetical protein
LRNTTLGVDVALYYEKNLPEVLRALDDGTGERRPIDAAAEFLREALATGERSTTDLQAEAKDAGHAWATVRRAQNRIRIKPYQRKRRWYWRMSEGSDAQSGDQMLTPGSEHLSM